MSQFFKDAYERIKYATGTKTQVEIAEVLEIRQSSISDAKRRDSIPGDWYMKLFEKFGLNPDWIKQGVGPMYLRTESGYEPQDGPELGLAESPALYGEPATKSVMLTVHGMACSYEDGDELPLLPQVGKISMPLSFVTPGVMVLRNESPCMQPHIARGAYFGVDTNLKVPISGMIYALYWPHEGLAVRRVFLEDDDIHYSLRCDAEGFAQSRLAAKVLNARILGRVTWILQQI